MLLWIAIVISMLVASLMTSGITSAILDFTAFLILLIVGVRRATGQPVSPSCNASDSTK